MTDLTLHVDNVAKHFASTTAVDGVSFDLGGNELLALVGPSGCGKSTLLRTLAGLHESESGSITLNGVVVDDGRLAMPPEDRHVGLVFQEHSLFPHLSVAKNVAFGVRSSGDDVGRRVDEMLELVGMTDFRDRFPHELSGGERQRIALARALAPRPSLMLLDEPFASLDPNLRSRLRDDIVAILRAAGTPGVFVTHDQNEALAVGDRIAVMNAGRIAQLGTPHDVFHAPTSRFVAAFMGEADFLTAAQARNHLDGGGLAETVGNEAVVVFRPDDVSFTIDDNGPASVTSAEFRGATWRYKIALADGAEVRSLRSHLEPVEIGTTVHPAVNPGHVPAVIPAVIPVGSVGECNA